MTWTVPEVVAGVDDWPKRWREKEAELAHVDWPNFRRNRTLMEGMQDPPEKLALWLQRTQAIGIAAEDVLDSPIGNPNGVYNADGSVLTTVGVRHAYYAHQILRRARRMDGAHALEIGGGFGGLVRALHRALSIGRVTLLDAPVCLKLQTRYLAETCPNLEVAPYALELRFDLVTNTHSFGEMTRAEVARYFGVIQSQLKPGGYFYTANRAKRCIDFNDYPYDDHWEHETWYTPGTENGIQWIERLSRRI